HYTATTMGAELYLSNVPLFDPVSFPFLAYAAFCLGRWVLGEDRPAGIVVLSGVMMMLLDVVIDPLAVRGDRWFLGRVFYYPEPGAYFGVPLSNFAGWMIVGWGIVGGYVWSMGRGGRGAPGRGRAPALGKAVGPGVALYYAVLLFNVAITISIGEWWLLSAGILVHGAGFLILYGLSAASTSRRRRAEPERDPAASRAGSTSH
ncbi:MAG TPA: carotenoid biosynthesis protein, partial [Candidatus Methylomirabilis sp.]|nr:carotenoid biosynthesis protein [Candidatus Methylomirabilis sp.]